MDIEKLQGDATVDSLGGIISVADVSGRLVVSSIGGDINIIRPSGHVEATSICGNIHFISPTSTALKVHNTSGKILYEGDFVTGGDYSFTSYSGDIDLFLPSSASFELNKSTGRGKFISENPCRRGRILFSARTSPAPRQSSSIRSPGIFTSIANTETSLLRIHGHPRRRRAIVFPSFLLRNLRQYCACLTLAPIMNRER